MPWFLFPRYNLHSQPPRGHRFSFFRALWLIWSMLFKAAVNVNFPKGMAARYLTMVWALFAVVGQPSRFYYIGLAIPE